jgi:hypothetical protein
MGDEVFRYVEIVNRLKRGTIEGRLLWQRDSQHARQYVITLDDGHGATVSCVSGGTAVRFIMSSSGGVETLHLDSSRAADDVLRLALLQLFVAVRDSLVRRAADEALDAVRDL